MSFINIDELIEDARELHLKTKVDPAWDALMAILRMEPDNKEALALFSSFKKSLIEEAIEWIKMQWLSNEEFYFYLSSNTSKTGALNPNDIIMILGHGKRSYRNIPTEVELFRELSKLNPTFKEFYQAHKIHLHKLLTQHSSNGSFNR